MRRFRLFERGLLALGRDSSGVAALEFAFLSMVFLTILAGTVDVGLLIYTEEKVDAAVVAGAQYAVVNAANVSSANGATLATTIASVVANVNGSNWAASGVCVNNGPTATANSGTAPTCSGTASNADDFYCPTGTPGSWSWGSSVAQGSSCSGGGMGGKFVTITASVNFTSLFPSFGLVQNGAISRSVLVETE
jgi:Flp pilus assembly protein TadG